MKVINRKIQKNVHGKMLSTIFFQGKKSIDKKYIPYIPVQPPSTYGAKRLAGTTRG